MRRLLADKVYQRGYCVELIALSETPAAAPHLRSTHSRNLALQNPRWNCLKLSSFPRKEPRTILPVVEQSGTGAHALLASSHLPEPWLLVSFILSEDIVIGLLII